MTLKAHTRLIVMGTPGFVLPTLARLIAEKTPNGAPQFDLVGVYTKAPKPTGRGLELLYSPVHQAALALQKTYRLPFVIKTPESFKNPKEIEEFRKLKPDLVVVGAYGLILPQAILDIPPMGCFNLHASLLPYGRGASPIQRAILDGKTETGLTIMKLDAGCDTGLILKQKAIAITPTMTATDLCYELSNMGPDLLMQTLRKNPKGKKQDEKQASYAKKITKAEAQIDWNKNPQIISRQVRAFSSIPGAFTFVQDDKGRYLRLKVFNASLSEQKIPTGTIAGTVLETTNKIIVACKGGSLELTDLQLEGKKRMTDTEFSNGHFLKQGDLLLNATEVLQKTNLTLSSASQDVKKKRTKIKTFCPIVSLISVLAVFRKATGAPNKKRFLKTHERV